MRPRRRFPRVTGARAGLTLIESMISIVILGMTVTGISAAFSTGLQALEQSDDVLLLDSALRSRMETLVSRPFDEVLAEGSGEESLDIGGDAYKATWVATSVDLDSNGIPEPDAMTVEVTLGGRSLSVLLVDHDGRLGVVP